MWHSLFANAQYKTRSPPRDCIVSRRLCAQASVIRAARSATSRQLRPASSRVAICTRPSLCRSPPRRLPHARELPPVPRPAAADRRARRPAPAGRHPPHRDAGRPGQDRALFPQGDRLRHAGRVRHHPHARARHHVARLRDLSARSRTSCTQAIDKPIPPKYVEDLADPRGGAARRRRRPLQAADPDVVDLRRRADDHRRRRDRARSGARHQQRHLPLHRQGEEPHRHRHRHAQQHAAVRAARVRAQGAAADLDLDRHPSDRDHRLGLSRAARRRRDGDRRRHPRRAGRARAVRDHRPALHRRRRDRAGGRDPADRLDLAGGPLRRVHAADGRAALEPAGAHQGDLDAQGRDLLHPAHAVGEHLARRADALRGDPHRAARPPACR